MNTKLYTCDSYLNAINKLSQISYKLLEDNPTANISLAQILPTDNDTYLVQILYTIKL
jgi:hypothetical protein